MFFKVPSKKLRRKHLEEKTIDFAHFFFHLYVHVIYDTLLVRVFQRSRTKRIHTHIHMHIHTQREVYFKELGHVIMEARKLKMCRVSWKAVEPKVSRCCSSNPKAISCRIHSSLEEVSLFCAIQAFN